MAGSDHIQVPIEALRLIQTRLTALQAQLDGVVNQAGHLQGADDIHGHKITAALASYFSEWNRPRRTLLDNVGKLGEVSGKIADVTAEFDDESAKGFNQFAAQLRSEG